MQGSKTALHLYDGKAPNTTIFIACSGILRIIGTRTFDDLVQPKYE